MGYNCYGTKDQFFKMTDKHALKKMCIENGVDVIPEYGEGEIDLVEYPVFVKPVDSRGSRGQSVCYDEGELRDAINEAKKESSNGDVIIEKYMKEAHEFQVTYFFIDGEPYLIRTCDSYCGTEALKLEKVVACAISPSRFTESYLKNAHDKVVKMFKTLGIKNGPIFMQGFEDNGVFRFFDPGLRFPGVDYERVYKSVFGIDLMDAMISIAINGNCGEMILPKDGVWLKGNKSAILFPTIKAGTISEIRGVEKIRGMEEVVSYLPRCAVGETISWSYNVNQRSAEVDVLTKDIVTLKAAIKRIQNTLKIVDDQGCDMTFELFDPERII